MTPAEERQKRRSEWTANRVAALQAVLNGDTDARAWLQSTGLTPVAGCDCPYCETGEPA